MSLWASKKVSDLNQRCTVRGNMSLYAKYLAERTGDLIKENAFGFATYRYVNEGKAVYIVDIYVIPELRKAGEASRLANEIVAEAKAKGCTHLIGSVVPSTKGSTESMKVLLAYGMSVKNSSNDFVVFKKEI